MGSPAAKMKRKPYTYLRNQPNRDNSSSGQINKDVNVVPTSSSVFKNSQLLRGGGESQDYLWPED